MAREVLARWALGELSLVTIDVDHLVNIDIDQAPILLAWIKFNLNMAM